MATNLIGRERERVALSDSVDAVARGEARTVLIGGEPGIGKSRLVEELVALAGAQGVSVLNGRSNGASGVPALWPWRQALASRREWDLLPSEGLRLPSTEALQQRWQAFDAVVASLAARAMVEPTAVIMEDLHWADESTLQLLAACAGHAGLLVVATYRNTESNPALEDGLAVLGAGSAMWLELRPWTTGDVAEFCRGLIDPSWVPIVHQHAGGVPLFVTVMVAALREAGLSATSVGKGGGWPLGVPARLFGITERRLSRLSPPARAAVLAVYLLDVGVGVTEVSELTGLGAAVAADALGEGLRAGVLSREVDGPLRVVAPHELLREAGYRAIDASTKLAWHLRAAEMIEAGRLAADPVTHRLRCITGDGDRDRAVAACRKAAAEAMGSLGFDRAVAVVNEALALPGLDARMRSELLLDAAAAEFARGAAEAALDCCQRVVDLSPDPDLQVRALLVVHGFEDPGLNTAIAGLCDRVLTAHPDLPQVARARATSQRALALALAGVVAWPEVDRISSESLQLAEASGDAQATRRALQARHHAITDPDRVDERIVLSRRMVTLALVEADAGAELWGRLWRVDAAWELGEPDVLRTQITRIGALAEALGWPLADWHAHRLRAALALLRGDFDVMDDEVGLARVAASRTRHPPHTLLLGLLDFVRRRLTGHLAEVADTVKAFAVGFGESPIAWSNGGAILLAAGEPDAAQACYERLRPVLRMVPRDGHWLFTLLGAGELAIAFGDADTMAWCRQMLAPYAHRFQASGSGTLVCHGSVAHLLGDLALATDDLVAADRWFSQAIAAEDRIGAVPYRTYSQLDLAAVLARRGTPADLERARGLVTPASASARRVGMWPAVARADELARTLRRATDAATHLTAREREVLASLAHGASNRAIATALVLSERTVEYHVGNALAKIGAANRTEAATWALRNGLGTTPY